MQPSEQKISLANSFFRLPRLTILAIGFILVMGISTFINIPRQEDPTMSERFALIETFMPGASAARTEALITEKLENALREIPEIKQLSSTSRPGHSMIQAELFDFVVDEQIDLVWSEVRDKLADTEAKLPADASKADLDVKGTVAVTLGIGLTSDNTPLSVMERVATELQVRLSSLAGTRETQLFGEPKQEILVEIDPHALARVNLSLPALASIIASSDTKIAAGEFKTATDSLVVEVKGELDSIERINSIPLKSRADGQVLRLSDVAVISKHYIDPPESIALINGKRGILVTTTMETGRRIDNWVVAAKKMVANYDKELPEDLNLDIIIDQNFYTSDRLSSLLLNLLMAITLVIIALFFLMGYRSALIVGSALPLTLAMVITGLQFLDIPLHQMSVTGLIIALGLLIDNAIVVVEEYKIQRRRGLEYGEAIAQSVHHLFIPLLASTMTTAFAFLPIALSPGGIGDFTGSMAIAVVLSVMASFLLSMTVIPSIAGLIDKKFPVTGDTNHWWVSGYSPTKLSVYYKKSINAVYRRPLLGIGVSLILPLCGFLVAGSMTNSFFPPVDRNQFQIQVTLPSSWSLAQTLRETQKIKTYIDAIPEIVDSQWFLGENAPAVYYNTNGNSDGVASYASAFVTTKDVDDPRKILPALQLKLMDKFPQARIMALPFEQGPPFTAPIEVRIVGPDLGILKELGEKTRLIMSNTQDITYTTASLSGSAPQVSVYPNEKMIRSLGLSNSDIPNQLNSELRGIIAGNVMEGSTEVAVRVRLHNATRSTLENLTTMPILSAPASSIATNSNDNDYKGIPLEQLADIVLEPSPMRIDRYQNERINTVAGFLTPYAFPSLAVEDFRKRLREQAIELPEGYRIEFGGEEEERGEAVSSIMATFVTFLWLMVAVIVLSLNSFRYAAIIGAVGFLSIGLALLGVWASGYPLGFTSLIGTLGLIGLAINGAIIVLSALKANPKALAGDQETVVNIVVESTRHIVSTTITTIGGFLPLILFGGHFWPPLAMAIAGGVAGSAILALYMVPSMFSYFSRRDVAREKLHAQRVENTSEQARDMELEL